ncbi:acid protease, partial [Sistotremastrum niveocremeum HHB9708]
LQLDTGSSDLWVASGQSISNSKASVCLSPFQKPYLILCRVSRTTSPYYGIGWAYGNINQAPVSFAGFTVQSQAYLLASQSQNPISSYGAVGIFGLGFDSLSSIDAAVNSSTSSSQGNAWGRSFLSNAFATDTSSPNFISFVLERDGDPDENGDVQGTFTIGEYASQYAAVANSPAIPTWPENSPKRWSVLLDNFYVGGVSQTLLSSVVGVPDGKVVILLDSGTSYSYASTDIVQAMYGGIKGASFSGGTWSVPCDAEVDVTDSLAHSGQPFPMHPLDIVSPSVSDPTQCVGTFLAQSLSVGGGEFDWLIGDNVLRSLYSVYDFGDYDSSGNIGNPYIKLLALTNATEASADFHTVRGGNANGTLSASGVNGVALNSSTAVPSTSTASPSSASSKASSIGATSDQSSLDKLLDYMPAILGILGLNSLLLLSLSICAALFFIRRRSNKSKKGVRG